MFTMHRARHAHSTHASLEHLAYVVCTLCHVRTCEIQFASQLAASSATVLQGIAAVDCAWPRPLLFEVLQAAVREILSLGLRARGLRPRKVYVKVATAEIEYLVWVHPGPKSLPAVPCVFLHGVGSGAARCFCGVFVD